MIAAPASNSGKSLICAGLLYTLRLKGLNIAGFKTGPDQVDRKLLEFACGGYAGNLDLYLMGEKGVFASLNFAETDYSIIEGVMGCFDGIGCTPQNSAYYHAEKLGINIVLVYSPQGEMFSMIPKLKGMMEYSDGRIKGIILNKISKNIFPVYERMLKENLPQLKVLGFVPFSSALQTEMDYLGLNLNKTLLTETHLRKIAEEVSGNIDMQEFLNLFMQSKESNFNIQKEFKSFDVKTAIARDDAFNMCYAENIFLFDKMCSVQYFSPLEDSSIPYCEVIYMSGGAINNFKKRLSENTSMRMSIKEFVERGGFLLAEGESLNYLFERYDGFDMCGVFSGTAESTQQLQNFGYNTILFERDNILGEKGMTINASEYHKSKASCRIPAAFTVTKAGAEKKWSSGYAVKNALGFYQNINYISCPSLLEHLYEKASGFKG